MLRVNRQCECVWILMNDGQSVVGLHCLSPLINSCLQSQTADSAYVRRLVSAVTS